MNQDFMLPGSAGMARRLVKLSKIANIYLDPEIENLAKTNLLGDADFVGLPFDANERAAIQSLSDFDHRAVLPGGNAGRVALGAAKVAGIEKITVVTGNPRRKTWEGWCSDFGIKDLRVITKFDHNESLNERRDGLLIIDVQADAAAYTILAYDFPKTIALSNHRVLTDAAERVSMLFHGAPHDILTNAVTRTELEKQGIKTDRLFDMAFLLNVVTDILMQPIDSNAPDDGVTYKTDDDLDDFDLSIDDIF